MFEVRIPKLGMSTVEVEITEVLVGLGVEVDAGARLLDVESEKVSYEIEAEVAGTVAEILVEAGDICDVGDVVMRIQPG